MCLNVGGTSLIHLNNPNSLGPELVHISGLVKQHLNGEGDIAVLFTAHQNEMAVGLRSTDTVSGYIKAMTHFKKKVVSKSNRVVLTSHDTHLSRVKLHQTSQAASIQEPDEDGRKGNRY